MREFFQGWRRKAGLVTLAMACVLMVAWMRSMTGCDSLRFPDANAAKKEQQVLSIAGRIRWDYFTVPPDNDTFWSVRRLDMSDGTLDWALEPISMHDVRPVWIIPYWSLVLPLTLLSAWLLLIKPRPAKSAKESSRA